jgi:hypothetical protein
VSGIPTDWREQIDLRQELARIDRDRAETQKLMEESRKLLAEGHKFERDPWILMLATLIAVFAAIMVRLPELLHAAGVGP